MYIQYNCNNYDSIYVVCVNKLLFLIINTRREDRVKIQLND